MIKTPLHHQLDTLPDLITNMVPALLRQAGETLDPAACRQIDRVYLTGCGDSHHAAQNAAMAFGELAGLPAVALPAMRFSRYAVTDLQYGAAEKTLLLAVSVSGQVVRTVEALDLAQQAGALGVAVTGNRRSRLGRTGQRVLETRVPPLPDELKGMVVPGTRSYVASQLALYVTAIHIGTQRGHLSEGRGQALCDELVNLADNAARTLQAAEPVARVLARAWQDADAFVFCGTGPNWGTAMFNAAKMLEASGDVAIAQELEEWAHLEYFAREAATPTFIISAGGRDADRAAEVAAAGQAIGRRVVLIAPHDGALVDKAPHNALLPLIGPVRECFSPLLTCLPGVLLAAERARLLKEPYFRAFGRGRSYEGGGGASRIRTGTRITSLEALSIDEEGTAQE